MRVGTVLLVLAVPGVALAQTDVRRVGDLVEVRATTVPLSDVLDRLARETGMEVVYDGAPPRVRVSLALPAASPAQAVLAVLEGHGLNYLARMDPTGMKIETLYIVSPGGAAASPSTAARADSRSAAPTPQDDDDDEPEPPEPVSAIQRPARLQRLEQIEKERLDRERGGHEPPDDETSPRPGGGPYVPGQVLPLMLPPGSGGVPGAPGPLRMPTRPAPTASPTNQ